MRLFYRADGSAEIGTGHLLRAVRIAAELRRRGDHQLILCMRDDPWAVERGRSAGLEVIALPLDLSPEEELERCIG